MTMIPFGLASVVMLGSAVGVVRTRNLVHAVFFLALMLLTTAALFVGLGAPFLAGIQVVLYTGGVITLMLFGVMLTQRDADVDIPNPSVRTLPAALIAVSFIAVLVFAIWTTPELATMQPFLAGDAQQIGRLFLGPHLIAFEALSVLLLAAMLGAIVLARKKDA